MAITDGKTHDITAARALQLPKGSIVVMDRGYNDYAWYNQLNNNDISFLTRLKTNARYRVIERRAVLKTKGLTSDQTIELTGARAKNCPIRLRRIGYKDADTGIHYIQGNLRPMRWCWLSVCWPTTSCGGLDKTVCWAGIR